MKCSIGSLYICVKDMKRAVTFYEDFFGKTERYDEIIKLAYEENPVPEKKPGKRGKQKRGKVLSLIDRLSKHKGEVCLFVTIQSPMLYFYYC